jgi:hypothetical protein
MTRLQMLAVAVAVAVADLGCPALSLSGLDYITHRLIHFDERSALSVKKLMGDRLDPWLLRLGPDSPSQTHCQSALHPTSPIDGVF